MVNHAQQQQSYPQVNQVRAQQVHQLATTYTAAVTLVNSPEQQEFRVPLMLKASSTPLYCKVVLH